MTFGSKVLAPALALSLSLSACATDSPSPAVADDDTTATGKADLPSTSCTNFSGFWSGVCEDNLGTVDPSFLALEQDGCNAIHTGFHPIMIGGENETEWKGAGFTARRKEEATWATPDQTVLAFDVSLLRTVTNGPTLEIEGSGTLELTRPDELVLTIDGLLDNGSQQIPHHQVCTYALAAAVP